MVTAHTVKPAMRPRRVSTWAVLSVLERTTNGRTRLFALLQSDGTVSKRVGQSLRCRHRIRSWE